MSRARLLKQALPDGSLPDPQRSFADGVPHGLASPGRSFESITHGNALPGPGRIQDADALAELATIMVRLIGALRDRISRSRQTGRWAGPAMIAVTALAALWHTWGSWPDPLVDFGRELYVPWQLVNGSVLYRDIVHLNGPFSPYLNAMWFALFGVSLRTLFLVNIAIWVLLLCMLYRILVVIGSRFSATVACMVFVLLFSFGQYESFGNMNYICPYSHEMAHGLVLSLAGIACLHLYGRTRRLAYAFVAGLILGLVFLTKAEVFLAYAAAFVTTLGLTFWIDRRAGARSISVLVLSTASVLLPITLAWVLLAQALPHRDALMATLGTWRYVFGSSAIDHDFYRLGMGTDDLVRSLKAMVGVTAFYGVFLLPAALVSMRVGRRRRMGIAAAVTMFVLTAVALGLTWNIMPWLAVARPLPLFMIALGALLLVHFARSEPTLPVSNQLVLQMTFVIFALTLLAKIILSARIHHYGFVLGMPAAMVTIIALLDWIPSGLSRLGGYGPVFRGAVLGGLLVTVAAHVNWIEKILDHKTIIVSSGPDAFRSDNRGRAVNAVVKEVETRLDPEDTLLVVPDGVMVNYLARRRTGTPYLQHDPFAISLFGESRILASLQARQPDYVLLAHRDTSKQGARFYGRDYGRQIYDWIESNYEPVWSYGAPPLRDERFGLVLLRSIHMNGADSPADSRRKRAESGRS